MSKKKLKKLERRVLALEMLVGLRESTEPKPAPHSLGAWSEEEDGCWARVDDYPEDQRRPACLVEPRLPDSWLASIWLDGKRIDLGEYDKRSAAMLDVDDRLREAGVVPETVVLTGICLRYSDGRTDAWGPGYGRVYPPCGEGHLGGASSIEEALDVLESEEVREMGWVTDTAIARAQLEEREAATIRESRTVENADSTEPTAALPLAGVVFDGRFSTDEYGAWVCTASGSTASVEVYWNYPQAMYRWMVFADVSDDRTLIEAGEGSAPEALAAAVALGAEVRA